MLNPAEFREIVSGRRQGVWASAVRGGLRICETPYALAMHLRNRRYDSKPAAVTKVAVPVISVGNLTLGGTGKTPVVEWIARWYRQQGVRVALVSRGYGAEKAGLNDEAMELEERLPDVPHLQDPDRVAMAQVAIDELEMQVIVLDDGFQHRRLGRDLDIVLIDALEPFGFEHVFPRGTLREPLTGLARADVVALSRADSIDAQQRQAIQQRVARLAPEALWCEIVHRPRRLINSRGEQQEFSVLENQTIAAFCGIGNPAGFEHTLDQCGFKLSSFRPFGDHHDYTREDIESLGQWANQSGAQVVVCTHKDLVKIQVPRLGEVPLWAVAIEAEFLSGQEEFEARLPAVAAEE